VGGGEGRPGRGGRGRGARAGAGRQGGGRASCRAEKPGRGPLRPGAGPAVGSHRGAVGIRTVNIYTRKGDDGTTNLCAGPRVAKDDPHIEACGTVDELNACLGLARAEALPRDIDDLLHRVQHDLFSVGSDLAMPAPATGALGMLSASTVARLERAIDLYDGQLAPLSEFILPGGTRAAALLHAARTVCRRAERRVVSLSSAQPYPADLVPVISYLNRLSDLLFVLPRVLNARAGKGDEIWRKEPSRSE
jgi:cob(I)alamin adenosyltransferase